MDWRRSAQAKRATTHTDPAAASSTGATLASAQASAGRVATARVPAATSRMPPASLPHAADQGFAVARAVEQAGDVAADAAVPIPFQAAGLMDPALGQTLSSTFPCACSGG